MFFKSSQNLSDAELHFRERLTLFLAWVFLWGFAIGFGLCFLSQEAGTLHWSLVVASAIACLLAAWYNHSAIQEINRRADSVADVACMIINKLADHYPDYPP